MLAYLNYVHIYSCFLFFLIFWSHVKRIKPDCYEIVSVFAARLPPESFFKQKVKIKS